jgi:NADPH-dependent 2,4-dienoyl-CoA reductase/sulfur reductase-like enzyme/nitrite reductase/ring-hydroxylating ferredoxin subunit
MADGDAAQVGPDLEAGVERDRVPAGGSLLGHAFGEAVLLVRPAGSEDVFAIGATCTHYGGPLAEGLVSGTEVRCPWHHARFDVRTGEAAAAPALNPLPCWSVERRGTRIAVAAKRARPAPAAPANPPPSVVIVGAGAAGNAAAEMLRREGYAGPVTLIGAELAGPVDRPNLSKDYLSGAAPEEWVLLHDREFFAAENIELLLGASVASIDLDARQVRLENGERRRFEALLLATGAEPIRLPLPGSDAHPIHYLRTLADSRAIIARATAAGAKRAVVVGASFIGLEAAAALRTRGLEVDVVAPDARPLERVLGPELGAFVQALHEEHGVHFHLGRKPAAIEAGAVVLDDGSRLAGDFVVAGVGVRPVTVLAEQAGLRVDRGVVVDEYLETSARGVYAAGDIARWRDPRFGPSIRIEHWVVAERQGQAAARNMLGRRQPYREVPFFWSQHYDVTVAYVGHAEAWDRVDVAGRIAARDCVVAYRSGGRITAVVTLNRDAESLAAEVLFERDDQPGLEALVARPRP